MAAKKPPANPKKPLNPGSILDAVNALAAEQNRQLREMRHRLLAIQLVLQERGLLTAAEVEERFEEVQKQFQPTEEAFLEEMRRILEKYNGPLQ